MMSQRRLDLIVAQNPYPEYAEWWSLGHEFSSFMAEAIVSQWSELPHNEGDLGAVRKDVEGYAELVYSREVRQGLVEDFADKTLTRPIQSGEFDALSYAFYKAAFELIEGHIHAYDHSLREERRLFTKRVGKIVFGLIRDHLQLSLPASLEDENSLSRLKECIGKLGVFLTNQGYLRDHFAFLLSVDTEHAGNRILQSESEFLANLKDRNVTYALYEMGFPVILPSAVYLYQMLGEAQHHSSRIIEELFKLVGCEARETDDFDPTGYPSDLVVELWEIRRLA
jgi:hypothetical protein